ncbi:ATP-binding protein [Motiliproteus sp. MSK22-1]|uniref:AAA family ATPase n=1 Tax=Motiliproteus sp. MSK22-1 TaxID=1897630 RepID=UPI000976EE3D|nr:ATP-binding protein [Motiliproteus sp. MSK22-1]OMH33783.1 hypothetical protein BGP75_12385 [Motiliproteus sp. MSK22-1]
MSKLFIIAGNTGAGKTTYAAKLAQQENAYVFSGDEWMKNLFIMDLPDPPSYEWALERTERIETQILNESLKLLDRKINVVLDIGFFAKSQRERVRNFYYRHGLDAITHYLDVDKETRWVRVDERNTQQNENYQFQVTRETFEFCETIFEPVKTDEKNTIIVTSS